MFSGGLIPHPEESYRLKKRNVVKVQQWVVDPLIIIIII
jgi:hypothetical protein